MIEVALTIESQNGLTWARWQQIVRMAEDAGYAGLYLSDHFTNPQPPDLPSLECWTALAWLAANTKRIEFGPLVSPLSFRDPAILARCAAALDDLSSGRLLLGLGAGWEEREHRLFGYELLDAQQRFERFREGIEIILCLLRSSDPVVYEGQFYHLRGASLLPRPQRPSGPPIVIGGNSKRRTLPLAARYGDEWNATFQSPEGFRDLSKYLDRLLKQEGRRPSEVRRTLMTGICLGRDKAEVVSKLRNQTPDEARRRGVLLGTASQIKDQLSGLAEVGVDRVMLQWLDLDDLIGMQRLADVVF